MDSQTNWLLRKQIIFEKRTMIIFQERWDVVYTQCETIATRKRNEKE